MGFGSFPKKAGNLVGKVGKVAAPIMAATGVGLPLSLAVGAGSGALEKATSGDSGGVKGVLGAGAKSGAITGAAYGGRKLLNGMLPPPGGSAPAAGGGTGWETGPGGVRFPTSLEPMTRTASGGSGGLAGVWDRIQNITGLGRPGGLDAQHLVQAGIGLYGAKQARDAGKKADDLTGERMSLSRDMLDRMRSQMVAPPPDLSFLQDNLNPYRKRFTPQAVQMGT